MQEVEATCKRILIINRGKLIADGSVSDLLETGKGRSEYTIEIVGNRAVEKLTALNGVDSHTTKEVNGRTRVSLSVLGDEELRPVISQLAQQEGWVLWELHKNQISLERLFRELTDNEEISK